jgi:hypothetical protein
MSEKILNRAIVNSFNDEFEWRCMSLLAEAYFSVKSDYCIDIDSEEEYISAVLFDYIDKCSQATEWHIDIVPEYRIYKNEILKRKKSAKTAPRIDLRFCGWTNDTKLIYFVEAKNLIETGYCKTVLASSLHKRYIETGIDSYLSGKYPANGCLVGYILQGKIENIKNCINQYLQNTNRASERLMKQSFELPDFEWCYLSIHKNDFTIKHLMFNFAFN